MGVRVLVEGDGPTLDNVFNEAELRDNRSDTLIRFVSRVCNERPDALVRIQKVADRPVWVSAYDHNRSFGGPEEGGWWFDTGVLLDSIPCMNDEQVEEAKARLKALHGPGFEGNHAIHSVLCEGQLQIVVEDKRGEDYPQETPHYE